MVYPGTLFHRRQRGIPVHSYENRSHGRALRAIAVATITTTTRHRGAAAAAVTAVTTIATPSPRAVTISPPRPPAPGGHGKNLSDSLSIPGTLKRQWRVAGLTASSEV